MSPGLVCVVDGPESRVAFLFSVKEYEKSFYRNVLPGIS